MKQYDVYTNKKNRREYRVLLTNIINATNEQDGQVMVVYKQIKGEQIYVRSADEFRQKFKYVNNG